MMSNRGMAVLALRLYAMALMAWVLKEFPGLLLPLIVGVENAAWLIPELLGLFALAVVAFWCWFRVGVAVEWLLPVRTAQQADAPLAPQVDEYAHVGMIAMVGLLVIGWALPAVVAGVVTWLRAESGETAALDPSWIGGVAQLLFGIALVLGRYGLGRLLFVLKHVGR